MNRSRGRAGFTLVEALMASAVLAIVSLGIFRISRSTNRQASQAAWMSAAQKQLRNGLKRIHDELSKASVYTRITPREVVLLDPDDGSDRAFADEDAEEAYLENYFVQINDAASEEVTYLPNGGAQRLLLWYRCAPHREGFGDEALEPGYSAIIEVRLEGETLVIQRDDADDPGDQNEEIVVELIKNVVSVKTKRADKADSGDPLKGSEITVEVTVHHPNTAVFPNSLLTQRISARVPVGTRELQ